MNWAGMSLAGIKSVKYDISGALGISSSLLEGLSSNPFFKGVGKFAGHALTAIEVGEYLNDWFNTNNYQLEEALYNHLSSDIWRSHTRKEVGNKFEYAMGQVARQIFEGKIEVRKASDIFGKDVFYNGGSLGMVTWQLDPLTGKNKIFKQDDYYFFMLDKSVEGSFKNFEYTIKNQGWY